MRDGSQTVTSCWVFTLWMGEKALWELFYKDSNPIQEGSSLMTWITSPRPYFLMPSHWGLELHHLTLCHPLLLMPSVFPSIRGFSNGVHFLHQVAKILALQLQHQSFQWKFRVDFLEDWLVWYLCCSRDSQEFSSPTVQKHQLFGAQPSLWSKSHICTWLLDKPWLWLYRPLSAKWCFCFLIR